MKIGLVGYQGSGKSTLFEWLTGVKPTRPCRTPPKAPWPPFPSRGSRPCAKSTAEEGDAGLAWNWWTRPGLNRSHEGNAARLALIRETGCLVLVVAAFGKPTRWPTSAASTKTWSWPTWRSSPAAEARRGLAPQAAAQAGDTSNCSTSRRRSQTVLAAMEAGKPLREADMNDEQRKVTRSFRLFSEKPRVVVFNTADDEHAPRAVHRRWTWPTSACWPFPSAWNSNSKMSPEDRAEFQQEMGVGGADRDGLLRTLLQTSGQRLFLTAGDKEVRTWLLPQGGTALDAAASIHSDLARGFIRAEIMQCSDLVQLGSEREVKAQHLVRQEPKDYVIQDDDILLIRFSV